MVASTHDFTDSAESENETGRLPIRPATVEPVIPLPVVESPTLPISTTQSHPLRVTVSSPHLPYHKLDFEADEIGWKYS